MRPYLGISQSCEITYQKLSDTTPCIYFVVIVCLERITVNIKIIYVCIKYKIDTKHTVKGCIKGLTLGV